MKMHEDMVLAVGVSFLLLMLGIEMARVAVIKAHQDIRLSGPSTSPEVQFFYEPIFPPDLTNGH